MSDQISSVIQTISLQSLLSNIIYIIKVSRNAIDFVTKKYIIKIK